MSFFQSLKSFLAPEESKASATGKGQAKDQAIAHYLLIIRHGRPDYEANPADPPLLAGEAAYLKDRYQEFEDRLSPFNIQILSSPLSRAQQTAQAFQEALAQTPNLEIADSSDLGGETVIQDRMQEGEALVLVAHEPYVSAWLRRFGISSKDFDKGDAALLAIDEEGKGRLVKYIKAH